jgi:GTP-binding protein
MKDDAALRRELELYDEALAGRPEIVVLNKSDLPETRRRQKTLRQAFARRGLPFFVVSTITGEGVPELLEAVWKALQQRQPSPVASAKSG